MRKNLLLLAITSLMACDAVAQHKKSTTEFSFNASYYFGLKKNSGGSFMFKPEYGKYFTDQFYLGVGSGIFASDNFSTISIPLFLRTEVDFPIESSFTPYLSLQGGYNFNLDSGSNSGHINPSVGIKMPVGKTTTFNIGFGYMRNIIKGGGTDNLGFNAGLSFDSSGKGMGRFLKMFDYSVELEMLTSVKGDTDHTGSGNKLTGIYGVRFAAITPVGIDNLYAGLTIGMGRFSEKLYYEKGNSSSESSDTGFYGNIMARGRYKVPQISIGGGIYPFVQLDMGASAYYDFAFTLNPAIGVIFETSGDHSFEVSAGYNTVKVDEDSSKGSLRLAIGYTF